MNDIDLLNVKISIYNFLIDYYDNKFKWYHVFNPFTVFVLMGHIRQFAKNLTIEKIRNVEVG